MSGLATFPFCPTEWGVHWGGGRGGEAVQGPPSCLWEGSLDPGPCGGWGEPEVIDTIAVSSLTHSHFHAIKSAFRNVSLKGK